MPKSNTTAVSFGLPKYQEVLDQIGVLDKEAEAVKGTQAQLIKDAAEAAGSLPILTIPDVVLDMPGRDGQVDCLTDWESWATDVTAHLAQQRDEFVSQLFSLRPKSDGIEAIKTSRAALVKRAEAMAGMLVDMGDWDPADIPPIPEAPKSTRSTSGSGKGKVVTYNYKVGTILADGVKRYQSFDQNSLSSIAFYHGKALVGIERTKGDKAGIPAEDLRTALKGAGQDSTVTTEAWTCQLPGGIVFLEVLPEAWTNAPAS